MIFRTFYVKLKKELIEGVTQNKEASRSNVSNGTFKASVCQSDAPFALGE